MPLPLFFFWRALLERGERESRERESESIVFPILFLLFLAFPRPRALDYLHQRRERIEFNRLELVVGGRKEVVQRGGHEA